MLLDRHLRFAAANAAYLRALFVRREDVIGRLLFEVFPHNPDDPNNESVRLLRGDGTYGWHLGRAEAYRDATGAIAMWFGTHTDIDDRKRAQDLLEERSEFEQHLIGIVSHDLRNPINAIGIAAALLRERGGLDKRQAQGRRAHHVHPRRGRGT